MGRKKANGEGTLIKKENGSYELQITIGTDPITGKLKRKSFSAKTQKRSRQKNGNTMLRYRTELILNPTK